MPRRLTLAQTTATGNGIDAALAAQPLFARIRDVRPVGGSRGRCQWWQRDARSMTPVALRQTS